MAATRYILRDGKPVRCDDLVEWSQWIGDVRNFRVGYDELPGAVRVSTAFLGVAPAAAKSPLLFQTNIFGGQLNGFDLMYHTLEEARAGHAAAVSRAREVGERAQ